MGTVIALLYSTEYSDRHGGGHSQDGVNDNDVLALKELAVWQGQPASCWPLIWQLLSGSPWDSVWEPPTCLAAQRKLQVQRRGGSGHGACKDKGHPIDLLTLSRLPPMQLRGLAGGGSSVSLGG